MFIKRIYVTNVTYNNVIHRISCKHINIKMYHILRTCYDHYIELRVLAIHHHCFHQSSLFVKLWPLSITLISLNNTCPSPSHMFFSHIYDAFSTTHASFHISFLSLLHVIFTHSPCLSMPNVFSKYPVALDTILCDKVFQ